MKGDPEEKSAAAALDEKMPTEENLQKSAVLLYRMFDAINGLRYREPQSPRATAEAIRRDLSPLLSRMLDAINRIGVWCEGSPDMRIAAETIAIERISSVLLSHMLDAMNRLWCEKSPEEKRAAAAMLRTWALLMSHMLDTIPHADDHTEQKGAM